MTIERGFCLSREFVPSLRQSGLPDKLIWQGGRGAEDLAGCLDSFRGRPGTLMVAPDLRVFGECKRDITAAMAKLERARIRVVDVIHPQDETVSDMLGRAHFEIDRRRFPDRRRAKRQGRLGGLEKARRQALARAGIDTSWVLGQIANEPGVNFSAVCRALAEKISESSLRRYYKVRT